MKKHIYQLIFFISYCIVFLYFKNVIDKSPILSFKYEIVGIINVIFNFILGILINFINKKISLNKIKINFVYLIVFIICIIMALYPWTIIKLLPYDKIDFLFNTYHLFAIFAGANFVNVLFYDND